MKIVKVNRKIRVGTWETNSSSAHTLSISKNKDKYECENALPIINGFVEVKLKTYGWKKNVYKKPIDKLSYIIVMALETSHYFDGAWKVEADKRDDWYYKATIKFTESNKDYNKINDLIKLKMNCGGIYIKKDPVKVYYDELIKCDVEEQDHGFYICRYKLIKNNKQLFDVDTTWGIDHASCEEYNSISDFLGEYGVSLKQFIFDDAVWLITQNDNDDDFGEEWWKNGKS